MHTAPGFSMVIRQLVQVDIKLLQRQQKSQCLLFNSEISLLMLIKLSREITDWVVNTLIIFLLQYCSSPHHQLPGLPVDP